MSKLIVTTMNGFGSFGDPEREPGTARKYLSHVVNDVLKQSAPVETVHEIRKGGPGTDEEGELLQFVLDQYEPNDVYVALGFSWGAYDTTKIIKRFNRDYRGYMRPTIICGLADMEWPGGILAGLFRRKTKRVGPVSAGFNVYQRGDVLNGARVRWKLSSGQSWYGSKPYESARNVKVTGGDHAGFDTSRPVQDMVGWCIGTAAGEVLARNRVGG